MESRSARSIDNSPRNDDDSTWNDDDEDIYVNMQRCQPCTLSGKQTAARFVCRDCPSPKRYWCGSCKGGHDALTSEHRIILLSADEADPTVSAHADQKFTLGCTSCDELLYATRAHGSCSKSADGKHNSEPLENINKQKKQTLRVAILKGNYNGAKNAEAMVQLQQQKQELATTLADFNTDVDAAAAAAAARKKNRGDVRIRPFTAEIDSRIMVGKMFTDSQRNAQVEADALLECKNDVEVFRKAAAITARVIEKPMEALPALPTLKFVPVSEEGTAEGGDDHLGDIKWMPPISHRQLPGLPGKAWRANDCSSIPAGDSSYSVVEVSGPKGGGLYITDGEGERKKINDEALSSVCTTETGGTVYTGGADGIIKKYSIREGVEFIEDKEVKVGDLDVTGLSIFPTNQNLAAVDYDCIYTLSSELQVLSTLKMADLDLTSTYLRSVACGPSVDEVFVIIIRKKGKLHYTALINLSTKTVGWKRKLRSLTGVKFVGDVVYCTGHDHNKLVLLHPTDGKLLQEVECPKWPRGVFAKGPLGPVAVISY